MVLPRGSGSRTGSGRIIPLLWVAISVLSVVAAILATTLHNHSKRLERLEHGSARAQQVATQAAPAPRAKAGGQLREGRNEGLNAEDISTRIHGATTERLEAFVQANEVDKAQAEQLGALIEAYLTERESIRTSTDNQDRRSSLKTAAEACSAAAVEVIGEELAAKLESAVLRSRPPRPGADQGDGAPKTTP